MFQYLGFLAREKHTRIKMVLAMSYTRASNSLSMMREFEYFLILAKSLSLRRCYWLDILKPQ